MDGYILAFDQGTTSSRAIIFDALGKPVTVAQYPFPQIYPHPGWVEHDPMVILNTEIEAAGEAFEKSGLSPTDIAGIGVTNQRETTIIWDKKTGQPIYNAIVWQCRRTAPICDEIIAAGMEDYIREKTGLLIDAYFSGTKIKWILDNVPHARERAEAGELLFGTIDTWLIWNLTGGKAHVSDYSNCSRTMLFDINELKWDEKISPCACCRLRYRLLRFMVLSLTMSKDWKLLKEFLYAAALATRPQPFSGRPASNPVPPKILTAPAALL